MALEQANVAVQNFSPWPVAVQFDGQSDVFRPGERKIFDPETALCVERDFGNEGVVRIQQDEDDARDGAYERLRERLNRIEEGCRSAIDAYLAGRGAHAKPHRKLVAQLEVAQARLAEFESYVDGEPGEVAPPPPVVKRKPGRPRKSED